MSDTKFTKGPWGFFTEPESERYCVTVDCGKVMRINIITTATDIAYAESLERVANAHLIAAAPELYRELDRLVNDHYTVTLDDANRICELLAKARGEQ